MAGSGEPVIEVMRPDDQAARWALRAYFDEVASRYYRRPATEDEIAAAMRDEPSDDLVLPSGLLLVAHEPGVLGCAGLRLLPGLTGEVTRVFVVPSARRRGLGARLLACLEDHARRHGLATLRLDTRSDLTEARRLYARHGYREVRPSGQGRYVDHSFEKAL